MNSKIIKARINTTSKVSTTTTSTKAAIQISTKAKELSIICGKWQSFKSDNFDEYLRALGD